MKIVEISASLDNGLKRYNVFEQVSISEQPFTHQKDVLYGVTKPTDIIQTNAPTNILVDLDGNPIGNSQSVYFGIRVYPFISARQQVSCDNNIITYGEIDGLSSEYYFPSSSVKGNRTLLPDPYTGQLYPQPQFVETLSNNQVFKLNYGQAMQQFINDCVFPTKPNLDLPGQSQSSGGVKPLPYFSPDVYMTPTNDKPKGILCLIQDKDQWQDANHPEPSAYHKYMVQFDGQNLNFKFAMAVNSDFTETPDIILPYLYRTYVALIPRYNKDMSMGVIMQCLLYDSNGNVISA